MKATQFGISMVLCSVLFHPVQSSTSLAATINASSCDRSAVATAISSAANGDTVIIPNGSCTWTSGISLSKPIRLLGQTKGSVVITHGAGSGNLLSISGGGVEVGNINFMPGSSNGRYMLVGGSGAPPLIHDNYFLVPDFQLTQCIRHERNGGIIYRNIFDSLTGSGVGGSSGTGSGCLQLKNEGNGSSWSSASTMGMTDANGTANTYIEDNTFNHVYLQAIDCDDNARTVIRYNVFNNSGFVCHGADTSTYGQRHTEVYNNTFIFTASGSNGPIRYPINLNWWWYVRGGTGLFADNIIANIDNSTWGSKSELSFIVQQLRRSAGTDSCCRTYPCKHQIGQSHNGSSLVTEPFYIWNNTSGQGIQTPGMLDYSPNECGSGAPSTSSFVQSGRDYVVGTPKPGYAKYTYPHPLRASNPGSNPPPASPTNLRIN